MAINRWGYIPDTKNGLDWDIRDHVQLAASIPASGSNRLNYMKNQGNHGSCTGFGITRLLRMALVKNGLPDVDLSELFAYWNNRIYSGLSPLVDTGASIRGSVDASRKLGICIESYWDYRHADQYLNIKPEYYAFDEALNHQTLEAYTVPNNPDSIRAALATGFGVSLGATVFYNAFELAPNGDVRMPNNNDWIPGAHNFVLDGWTDSTGRYSFANSWGMWGNKGFGTIPYDYISKYAGDLWVVNLVESANPPPSPTKHKVTATVGYDLQTLFDGENLQNIRVDNQEVWKRV